MVQANKAARPASTEKEAASKRMKLCRFLDPTGQPAFGFYDANRVAPCNSLLDKPLCDGEFWSRIEELSNVYASLDPASMPWQARPTRLLPPLPTPEKIICIGLNYLDHAIETGATPPTEPVVFSKFATALVGDGDEIQLPRLSQQVDYEAELVVVIGKAGKQIPKEDAMQYVAGYTCGHDVSARDWQKGRPGGQWLLGKTFDNLCTGWSLFSHRRRNPKPRRSCGHHDTERSTGTTQSNDAVDI